MINRNRVQLSKLALGLAIALAAAPAFAQSTSSGVGGLVTDSSGAPVSGAEVTITHVASGTVSRATTDASGRYTARGLRVGGPYTISVTKTGVGTDTEGNVYLDLSQASTVDATLGGPVVTLDKVTAVAGASSSVFSATKMGSGTSIDQNTLRALPSVNGNIQDFMRLDPRVAFTDVATADVLGDPAAVLLDVRRDDERARGFVAGSQHIPLSELPERIGELSAERVFVHCGSGFRAAIAASLLDRAEVHVVHVDDDFAAAEKAGLTVTRHEQNA